MKEIEQTKKPFFRLHIEQNIEKRQNGNLFQFRTNRWRLATFHKKKILNAFGLRGPIIATFLTILFLGGILLFRNNWNS